jgi:GNAT superfamily N-acetyltransferase
MSLTIVPANHASWEDVQLIFGDAGYPARCQCQRYKMGQAGYAPQPREARAEALREDTQCGQPDAVETSGLVAYVDGEPAGWVAVEPRVNYRIFLINEATATVWRGREQDRTDPSIWAVTCFRVRKEFQGEGLTYPLAAATVPFARERGARILEGYPIVTDGAGNITWGEVFVGPLGAFLEAGFEVVHQPSKRRRVVRIEF